MKRKHWDINSDIVIIITLSGEQGYRHVMLFTLVFNIIIKRAK